MPEKPEVMCVSDSLRKKILKRRITGVRVYWNNIIASSDIPTFINQIVGEEIRDITTRGKFIVIKLTNYALIVHLRMEGKFIFRKVGEKQEKHQHVEIILDDQISFRYMDVRKFGKMYLIPLSDAYNTFPLNNVGPDFYDDSFTGEYLYNKIRNKKIPIKSALLDQSIIAGLGNIYVDEVLYMSKIDPRRSASSIRIDEANNIIKYSKEVLALAYKLGGSTIRTFTSSEGVHGSFQDMLLIHGRERTLDTLEEVIKIKIGGRGTYYTSSQK